MSIGKPSADVAELCRRPYASTLPYKIESPLEGVATMTLEIKATDRPYLTSSSSARPNTPRCKISVRLVERAGKHSLLARATEAALDVCKRAD